MKKQSLVTCVYTEWYGATEDTPVPKKDQIYTVKDVMEDAGQTFVTLEEVHSGPTGKSIFHINGFREVQTAAEGMNILEAMQAENHEAYQTNAVAC
jgi:hypothetical protein